MPTLPDASSLGGMPTDQYARPLAVVDTAPLTQGVKDLGKGVSDLGGGLVAYGREQKTSADALSDAKATASYLSGRATLDDQRDDLTDPDELKAHGQKYVQNLDTAAAMISDPQKQAIFKARYTPDVTKAGISVSDRVTKLTDDQTHADTNANIDSIIRDAQNPNLDDKARGAAVDSMNKAIDGLAEQQIITQTQAQALKLQAAGKYGAAYVQSLPASARIAVLTSKVEDNPNAKAAFQFFTQQGWTPAQAAGIVGNLLHESGGRLDPSATAAGDGSDGSDSIGIGQWNSDRAQALKAFAASQGKSWNDFGTQLAFVQHELAGRESAAAGALQGAQTPAEATAAFLKFERPKGYELGLQNAAGGAQRLGYAQRAMSAFGGDGSPLAGERMAQLIDPNTRVDMLNQATRDWTQQQRVDTQAQAQERATVKSLIDDDTKSIGLTGKPLDILSPERVGKALGPQEQAQFLINRQLAQNFHDATNDWDNISDGEIATRVESLNPKASMAGKQGFEQAQTYYEAAKKASAQIIKTRADDPAGAVSHAPAVQAATQAVDPKTPASFLPVVKARMTAQAALGIAPRSQSPITAKEADDYTTQMLPLTKGQANVFAQNALIDGVISDVKAKYGDFAPQAMTQILSKISLSPEASYAVAAAVQKMNPLAAVTPAGDLPPAPAGVKPEGWKAVMSSRPLDATGKPMPADEWAAKIALLAKSPTETTVRMFNNSKFGRAGFDGAKILKQLAGAL